MNAPPDVFVISQRLARFPWPIAVAEINALADGGMRRAPELKEHSWSGIAQVVLLQLQKSRGRGPVIPREFQPKPVRLVFLITIKCRRGRCHYQGKQA